MRNFILSLSLFFCVVAANAQLVSIASKAAVFKPSGFMPADDGFIAIKKEAKPRGGTFDLFNRYKATLVKYDQDMKVVKEQPLFNGSLNTMVYLELQKSSGNYWVVYCEPLQKNKFKSFYAMQVDAQTLATSEPKLIAAEDKIDERIDFGVVDEEKNVNFKSSPSQRYHALLIDNLSGYFFLECLDDQMQPVWNSKQKTPDFKQEYLNSMAVDDEGNIYISYVKDDKAIISVFNAKGIATQTPLNFGDIKPAQVILMPTRSGTLMAGGLYKENSDYGRGIYTAVLNKKSFAAGKIQKTDISEAIMKRLDKDGLAKSKPSKFGVFTYMGDTKFYGDEQNLWVVVEFRQSLGSGRALAEASLLAADLSTPNPTFAHIPRYAVTSNIISDKRYFAINCTDKLMLLYKDHQDNLSRDLSEDQKVLNGEKGAVLIMASISKDGTVKRKEFVGQGNLSISEGVNKIAKDFCEGTLPKL